jgi:cell division protein FtsB
LEKKKGYYISEIKKTKKALGDLENNPATLEKYARERYLMKKDGEDIFIIEDSAQEIQQ